VPFRIAFSWRTVCCDTGREAAMQKPFQLPSGSNVDPRTDDFIDRLGSALQGRSLIDEFALRRARRAQAQSGERFDLVLSRLGLVTDTDLASVLSEMLAIPSADPNDFPQWPLFAHELQIAFLRSSRLLPLLESDDGIVVATSDPFNTEAISALGFLLDRPISLRLAGVGDIERHIEWLYGQKSQKDVAAALAPASESDDAGMEDVRRLEDMASEAPIIKLVQNLVSRAVEMQASDIHIEPREDSVRVRMRIDGVLHTVETLPLAVRAALASRIKIMAQLNIAERRLPQDGRTKVTVRGHDVDLRVSSMPTVHGESVVLRILDRASVNLAFPALGFSGEGLTAFERILQEPNGIILVTGPTGSGKTTTLYTALSVLNDAERKLFTVEDPIEYQLAGINQIQVSPKIGLTFATALRSILRQDPDIIMVGEIRDLETAEMAIRASLTGHLVLSTVHTNSAAATITRLLDMGVADYLLASSLKGVLAQRLVRKLCSACSKLADVPKAVVERLAGDDVDATRLSGVRKACGCAACRQTGYAGRTTIYELLPVGASVKDAIVQSGSETAIEAAAEAGGMTLMRHNGLEKVLNGETTIEEVLRVTGGE
jgi:general secretion pathway protein E